MSYETEITCTGPTADTTYLAMGARQCGACVQQQLYDLRVSALHCERQRGLAVLLAGETAPKAQETKCANMVCTAAPTWLTALVSAPASNNSFTAPA